ncbi:hypothetical protein EZJ49_03385 [Bdellovibrio bacteriovorus]|uniref:hypothetical protein n=1 Tax=Bdellovibrio bacteriovorus TaxID=959 RepID=UPI0021D39A96|nr:hypothetical protein [Bdellovibrio bacteriovorus]UXR65292.1 hypothetical protein EZJ49_03385 [Bdellovibrio bacteriovorus]
MNTFVKALLFSTTFLTITTAQADTATSEICRIVSPVAHTTKYLSVSGDDNLKTVQILNGFSNHRKSQDAVLKTYHVKYRNQTGPMIYYTGSGVQFRAVTDDSSGYDYALIIFDSLGEMTTLLATCK